MKNKKILWKRRIATGLCMALLAVTIVSPMSFAAESTSSELSGENVSTTEHITNVDSNILPEYSNSSAISTESSISSKVPTQSYTDDIDDTNISSNDSDIINPLENDEDSALTDVETQAVVEKPEVATSSEANSGVQTQPLEEETPQPASEIAAQPATDVNGIFIVTNDRDDSEIGRYDTLLDASLAASTAMVTQHLGDSYTITVTQDYDQTDSVISTEVGMNLTVRSTPGEQFVLTRKLAGPPWPFAASPRHFVLVDK